MNNWYFVVGLFLAGLTWYVLYYSNFFPDEDRDIFSFVIAWGMIALWGLVAGLLVIAIPVVLGVYVGKRLLKFHKRHY